MRRAADVCLAGVALLITAPLLAAAAVAVRIVLGRPVLFRQVRSGLGGQPFTILKLRTMTPAAAGRQGPEHDAERLCRLGRLLRATSIDEIPTFVNVLRGEMSLVGPRPLPVSYLARYDDVQARRLEVRPGVTGWAQIHGRNATGWNERLAMDVWYVDHRRVLLDLRILAATLRTVCRRHGVGHGDGPTMHEFRGPGS